MSWKTATLSEPAPARRARDQGFARAFADGMRAVPKRVPCKYFYDTAGSALFERICGLPEYYQTRTELQILARSAGEIAGLIGEGVELIEFGAGALTKVRVLLDALKSPAAYIPIDISGEYLAKVCAALDADYPTLSLHPVVADFTRPFGLPAPLLADARRIGFFPGSTIGNFSREEAVAFLRTLSGILKGGGLLIGADLVKDPALLHAAYNDATGVTAAFNRNLLVRANAELAADFDPEQFAHYAPWNPHDARVEMYLVSRKAQRVRVGDEWVEFLEGEVIHTEDSHKYTIASFDALAQEAGFLPKRVWCDDENLFSVHWLEAK
jgi:dimethylhistidine N-methyltransferase